MKRNHTLAEMERFRFLSLEYSKGNMPSGRIKPKKRKLPQDITLSRRRTRYVEYLQPDRWAEFRAQVLRERGRKCEQCSTERGVMHVHHKTYQRLGRELPKDVEVLCVVCHDNEHPESAARWAKKREGAS